MEASAPDKALKNKLNNIEGKAALYALCAGKELGQDLPQRKGTIPDWKAKKPNAEWP